MSIDYKNLLKKYKVRQVGEYTNKEFLREEKKNQRLKEYLSSADAFCSQLHITGTMKDELFDIIREVPLKCLHRYASFEQIILCLCVYVKKSYYPSFQYDRYSIFKEWGVDDKLLVFVLVKLVEYYRQDRVLPFLSEVGSDFEY